MTTIVYIKHICKSIKLIKIHKKGDKTTEFEIGSFVETIHDVNGILIGIRESAKFGELALIATADDRVFQCPIEDLRIP